MEKPLLATEGDDTLKQGVEIIIDL